MCSSNTTYPALVTDALRTLAANTDANDVGRRVEEALGQLDQLLVAHLLNEVIDGHRADKLIVADRGAIAERDDLLLSIHLDNLALLAEPLLLLREGVRNSDPDTAGTIACREPEGGIGTPVTSNLVEDDVLSDQLEVRGSDTLAEPLALHLERSMSKGITKAS